MISTVTRTFYKIINKAHHQPANITPCDAEIVKCAYDCVHALLERCESTYTRFRSRPGSANRDAELSTVPPCPPAARLPDVRISMLGKLAAQSYVDILAPCDDAEEFSIDTLGPVVLYVVRGSTLGLVALQGQVVIASLETQAVEGDLVVALYGNKTYVRRFHHDRNDSARISLISDRSGTENVPPALLVPATATRVLPIIGVLYDSQKIQGLDEAIAVDRSETLSRKLVGAKIVEYSAYPVIQNGDVVLLEEIEEVTSAKLNSLNGRIVALTARNGSDTFGYLKRLGQDLGGGRHIYENIGSNGKTICIPAHPSAARGNEPWLDKLWTVHGFFRYASKP